VQYNSETLPVAPEVVLFLISPTKIWPVFHAHILLWYHLRSVARLYIIIIHPENGIVSWRQQRFVLALRSPPGSANIFRTCWIPPDIRSDRVCSPPSKKKKKERKIEETIVSAPFVRTKGDPRILIVVHYLAFPVFVYAHTTSCVRRIYTHSYIFIRRYIYIMCALHICGGFSFSGEKVVQSEVCASYTTYIYFSACSIL